VLTIDQASAVALIGLVAGTLGGIAGIGGAVLILPSLHMIFSPYLFGASPDPQIHHTFMAAAMSANLFVTIPAAIRHHREGAVRVKCLYRLIVFHLVSLVTGVQISNLLSGAFLQVLLAVALILYCFWNLRMLARPRRRGADGKGRVERITTPRLATCGLVTGFVGGVLGLGGGFLLVPLLQLVCNLRLKNAIATSAAVLCVTAGVGAVLKLVTLTQHEQSIALALTLAGCMVPTAMLGGWLGAKWVHRMSVGMVRLVMTALILIAATKLL
jgi:hypothetical protein